MRFKQSIFFLGILISPSLLFSQVDTLAKIEKKLNIDQIIVRPQLVIVDILPTRLPVLGLEQIQLLAPTDAGELLGKFSGSAVRSYGGLGGLKTISVRGLGSQHASIVLDNFAVSNAQTGQANLGQIQMEGIESASMELVPSISGLGPVSASVSGSVIQLSSFQWSRSSRNPRLKFSTKYGSFNQKELFASSELVREKIHLAAYGKFRDASGNYPFQVMNGNTLVEGTRKNNDFRDYNFGGKIGLQVKDNGYLNLMYRGAQINQGLPGAVLLYNETADERMQTSDHQWMGEFRFQKGAKMNARVYSQLGLNVMNYLDSSYLNQEGKLEARYQNFSWSCGYVESRSWKKFKWKWGAENVFSVLNTNQTGIGQPIRSHAYVLLAGEGYWNQFTYNIMNSVQIIQDQNRNSEQEFRYQWTPVVQVNRTIKNYRNWANFWYKRTFRMPTFNELYFGSVGNLNLKPEIAHQINLEYQKFPKYRGRRFSASFKVSAYWNEVRNKIVAIPTKNLFVWSMQNVEHARIYGTSADVNLSKELGYWSFRGRLNYTWQRVLDVTPGSVTFGDQVAYTPEHTGNADLSVLWKKSWSLNVANNFVSGRYALNENIVQNWVDGFWTLDLGLRYEKAFENGNVLAVQANAKNVLNQSYSFIRSYVMPGRHYLISLSYALH